MSDPKKLIILDRDGVINHDSPEYINEKYNVDTVFGEITKSMKKGDRVQIAGFGSFFSKKRPGRKGINPATGESIRIKTKFVPAFKAGTAVKEEVAKRRK